MRLSYLSSLICSAHPDLLRDFEGCGIKTDVDLFAANALDIFKRLPPGTVSLQELRDLIALIAEAASAPGICAADLLASKPETLDPFGLLPPFDKLLPGFGDSRVLEISGDSGAGKSTLALNVVLRHLAKNENIGAIWIDTSGDFVASRAGSVLSLIDSKSTGLDRLQVTLAFDLDTVQAVLEELKLSFTSGHIKFVVIDTITSLLGPNLSGVSAQGHAMMTAFMWQLRSLAQTHAITILVINNATPMDPTKRISNPSSLFAETIKKPALGPSFPFLTDGTLWLARFTDLIQAEEQDDLRVAEVFRSKSTPSKLCTTFRIREGVVCPTTVTEGLVPCHNEAQSDNLSTAS